MQNPLPAIDAAAPSAGAFDLTLKRLALLLRLAEGVWVLAVYRNRHVRQAVTEELRVRVAPLPVVTISLATPEPDLLTILNKAGAAASAPVVGFTDLRAAGPRLIRSLDLEREALARLPYRLVFWVTEGERGQLAARAPNFYSRLSGTFLFLDEAEQALEAQYQDRTPPPDLPPALPADLTMTPEQQGTLWAALLAAFPQASDLARMVDFGLDANLSRIAGDGSLDEVADHLIRWAVTNHRSSDLIRAALLANPNNADLRAFAEEVGLPAGPASGPTSLTLSSVERAGRYQALQAAYAAGEGGGAGISGGHRAVPRDAGTAGRGAGSATR